MGKLLASPMKVGLKSTNWYNNVMIIDKNYLMLFKTFLNAITTMYFSNKIRFNYHWVIQSYNKALDENGSKFIVKCKIVLSPLDKVDKGVVLLLDKVDKSVLSL